MKKLLIGCFSLIFIVSFFITTDAQTVKSTQLKKPRVVIELNGGYSLPTMQLNGDFVSDIWKYLYYGTKQGFGLEIKTKLAVLTRPTSQLRTTLTLGYSHFTNDETSADSIGVVQPGWPTNPTAPSATGKLAGIANVRMNIPYAAFGIEYALYTDIAKRSSVNLGFDINMNLITGRVYETLASTGIESFNTFNTSLRFGVGANLSYSYRFSKSFGFNLGTKFHFANLLGKTSEASTEIGYIPLLDKGDKSIHPELAVNRNIGFFNFFGGFSLYLGER